MTGIGRLRKLESFFERLSGLVCYGGEPLCDVLHSIASQIELEITPQERRDEPADSHADVSMSAYDLLPEDEREAIAWVREHGGIESVKEKWTGHVPRSSVKRMVELHEKKRDRLKAHALWLERKCHERRERIKELEKINHAHRDVINSICERLGLTDGTGLPYGPESILAELDRRLMPEGTEWPRYEDGELDADGAETHVGDTVWDVDGFGPFTVRRLPSNRDMTVLLERDGTFHYRYAERLTHERPDSWERFEDDCDAISEAEGDEVSLYAALADYCSRRGLSGDDHISLVARDLARRARAFEGRR